MRSPFPEVLRLAGKPLVGLGTLGLVLSSSPTAGFHPARFPARRPCPSRRPASAADKRHDHRRSLCFLSAIASRRSSLRRGIRAAACATEVSVEKGEETSKRRHARLPEEHLLKPFFSTLEEVLTR